MSVHVSAAVWDPHADMSSEKHTMVCLTISTVQNTLWGFDAMNF